MPTRPAVLIGASALFVAAVGVGGAAYASHISSPADLGGTLTSSSGSATISVSGGTAIAPQICDDNGANCVAAKSTDAQWSPDGSRVAFVNQNRQIETTVRTLKGYEWASETPANGVQRSSPTFDSTGQYLIWSERASSTTPYSIVFSGATPSSIDGDANGQPYQWFSDTGYDFTNPDAGPGGVVAYQRNTDSGGTASGVPEVWLGNFITGTTRQLLDNASQPAVIGDKVAFVRSDGTNNQIFVAPYDASGAGTATQLTSDAANHTNPTFSADGSHIAFTNANGSISVVPAAGGDAQSAGISGVPAYQTLAKNTVYRISGANRFSTSTAVSKAHWDAGAANAVVLSRSDDFADALGGSALAAAKHGPLLLTPPTSLNATTSDEISRVLGTSNAKATVFLLGGTGAISTSVENAVKALGYQTVRVAGADRYATSLAIAKEISPTPGVILAATGKNFPDALAAGAAAGTWTNYGSPGVVVLTNDGSLPAATKAYLSSNPKALLAAIGGQAVTALKSFPEAIQLAGTTRYQTAAWVAEVFFGGTQYAGVATGTDWPDALSGGALLGSLGGPLLLTNGTAANLDANTAWVLSNASSSIANPLIFGGTGVVTDNLAKQAGNFAGPVSNLESNPTGLPVDPWLAALKAGAKSALAKTHAKAAPQFGKTDWLNRR